MKRISFFLFFLILVALFVSSSPAYSGGNTSFYNERVGPPSCTVVTYSTNDDIHNIVTEELRKNGEMPLTTMKRIFINSPFEMLSGVFVDSRGFVLTNSHGIPSERWSPRIVIIWSSTYSGYRHIMSANLIARDVRKDLALLKVEVGNRSVSFPTVEFGKSPDVGAEGISIGAPFGLDGSVAPFFVSAKRKGECLNTLGCRTHYDDKMDILQVSGNIINTGSSGGPLFVNNKLVGIFTSVIDRKDSGDGFERNPDPFLKSVNSGISFAIPVNEVVGWLGEVEPSIKH